MTNLNEDRLFFETDYYRVFKSDGVFCGDSYYSPQRRKNIPITVTYDTSANAITITCCDGSIDCCALAQALWGSSAGGRPDIAGSPQGIVMNEGDLYEIIQDIKDALTIR